MCGRYTQTDDGRVIAVIFKCKLDQVTIQPNFNVAPGQQAPVVVVHEGERAAVRMKWGLVPFWAKDSTIGHKLINARGETAAEKPSFRQAFVKRRCLVAASGFFEWTKPAKGRQPFLFQLKEQPMFAFAGLWETWGTPESEKLHTYTIITTDANDTVKAVHHRMPVILAPDQHDAWLDPGRPADALKELLRPFPANRMNCRKVSTYVNSPRNNDPACIEAIED